MQSEVLLPSDKKGFRKALKIIAGLIGLILVIYVFLVLAVAYSLGEFLRRMLGS